MAKRGERANVRAVIGKPVATRGHWFDRGVAPLSGRRDENVTEPSLFRLGSGITALQAVRSLCARVKFIRAVFRMRCFQIAVPVSGSAVAESCPSAGGRVAN